MDNYLAACTGSLIVTGSHVSDLLALLVDQRSPLFARIDDRVTIPVWSPYEIYAILQQVSTTSQWGGLLSYE
jgi:hypothetical protein